MPNTTSINPLIITCLYINFLLSFEAVRFASEKGKEIPAMKRNIGKIMS